jgi:hypothetical protein
MCVERPSSRCLQTTLNATNTSSFGKQLLSLLAMLPPLVEETLLLSSHLAFSLF